MIYLKETVTKQLAISAIGSVIAAAFLSILVYIFDPPTRFPWVRIISVLILVFIALACGFWVNAFFNYINKVLMYIQKTGTHYLGESATVSQKEEEFHSACLDRVDVLLQKTIGALGLKSKLIKDDETNFCSAVLFPENEALVIRNFYDPNGKFGLSIGDEFKKDHYFASWVFDEEKTRLYNKQRKNEKFFGDFVLAQRLPFLSRDVGALPFRCGISVPLKYEGKTIAVLVVGADKKYHLTPEDVVPVAIMGQYLTVAYSHLKDYCPWHRQGWRDEKLQSKIRLNEFTFSPEDYQWTPTLEIKLNQVPSAVTLSDAEKANCLHKTKDLCQILSKLQSVDAIYLCGTFNGWNPSKTLMRKDAHDLNWRCFLNLPKGEYWYQFRLLVKGDEKWAFDPKFPLWIDPARRLQSVLKLI
jgi:hypothetical protein